MANLELATHLHVAACPAADSIPPCANSQHCSLSCVSLFVDHLEKCTRCVQHLCGDDAEMHTTTACNNNHCQKVVNCWKLKGEITECCFKHKLKLNGYVFEQIARQLEVLFKLNFENITYNQPVSQFGNIRANASVEMINNDYVIKNTAMLFDFLQIFKTFKVSMAVCDMALDSSDLGGILQTIIQQYNSQIASEMPALL